MSDYQDESRNAAGAFPEQLAHVLRVFQEEAAALESSRAEHASAFAEADEKRAEAARAGDLGPEWRTVQRRIDTGLTTFADVFSGADMSREAEALRAMSRRNLALLRASWEDPQTDEDDEARPEERAPHLQARGLAREAQSRYEQIAAQIAQTLRSTQRGAQQ